MMRALLMPLAMIVVLVRCQPSTDLTRTPDEKGANVVEATIDRIEALCSFTEDKLMFRRIAYVETSDGMATDTYRSGYHGGIWKVDEAMLTDTQSSTARYQLLALIQAIQTSFGIDWPSVQWSELRKPLYSALGARLYFAFKTSSATIPRDIAGQAMYWQTYYRPSGLVSTFTSSVETLDSGCKSSNGPDLLFVLDGSGSIGSYNFVKIISFVKDVVQSLNVGGTGARIGVIQYSSSPRIEFHLKHYQTKSDIINAVSSISYMGGGTRTYYAVDLVRTSGFVEANGARPLSEGHPRVAIVLTDGRSSSPGSTIAAANRCHAADITMFAIGVGSNLNHNELEAIASTPTCVHTFLLAGFSEIASLKAAIEKQTCAAPVIFNPGNGDGEIDTELPAGGEQNCKLKLSSQGTTVKMTAKKGTASYFVAQKTYPSDVYYERKMRSEGPADKVGMFIPQSGADEIFCHFQGDADEDTTIDFEVEEGDTNACASQPCENGGECEEVNSGYNCKCQAGYGGNNCHIVTFILGPGGDTFKTYLLEGDDEQNCTLTVPAQGVTIKMNTPIGAGTYYLSHTAYPDENSYEEKISSSATDAMTVLYIENAGDMFCHFESDSEEDANMEILIEGGDTDYCSNTPCKNDASCKDMGKNYNCVCMYGYEGTLCENKTALPRPEGAKAGHYHFAYDGDSNRFIQCTGHGTCYVMQCPAGLVWDAPISGCNWP